MCVYRTLSEMPLAFPDLLNCFQFALTIPVASATAERSFSAMKRVKTHLRSSIRDSKLSDMTLISMERNLSSKLFENTEAVIDVFASKSRRLELSL